MTLGSLVLVGLLLVQVALLGLIGWQEIQYRRRRHLRADDQSTTTRSSGVGR